jgi:hypothetical protein
VVLKLSAARVGVLIWVFIYGGLIVVGWGLSVQRSRSGLGLVLIGGGSVVAAAGFLLIYVRSRMKTPT